MNKYSKGWKQIQEEREEEEYLEFKVDSQIPDITNYNFKNEIL